MRKFNLNLAFTVFLFLTLPFFAKASGASLYLSPGAGSFFVGSIFDVSIFVNTGGEDVNAVEVNLEFDPLKLQVASPSTGKSFIEVWVSQPTYSNRKGKMSFMGGIPSPGINTSSGLVSTVTLRAIAPGETTINFFSSSKVLLNDSEGTNVLNSMGRGVFDILIPPPEGPEVFSSTHPDKNKWYKNNNPTLSWEKEEGTTDFSYSIDQDFTFVPDNEPEGERTSISFNNMESGMWYFHIKARKEGIWGGTTHYPVNIDIAPPASFSLKIEPSEKTLQKQPLVFFMTTDSLSGVDYYQIKYIDITQERGEEQESGFFVEANSPHKFPLMKEGRYLIVVRAYDKAGNYKEATTRIQIYSDKIIFSAKGIAYKAFFVSWWLSGLFLLFILAIILLLFIISQKKKLKEQERKLFKARKKVIHKQ